MSTLCGLNNVGNTCYLNTTLQCLIRCPQLFEILKSNCNRVETYSKPEKTIFIKLHQLCISMKTNSKFTPNELIQNLELLARKNKHLQFSNLRLQHDMSEFLMYIVNKIHEAISHKVSIQIKGTPDTSLDNQTINAMTQFKEFFSDNYSDVVPAFFGQFQSSIHYINSNKFSYAYNPFMSIQLDIPNNTGTRLNLYDCFNKFTSVETINSDETKIHMRFKIWKFPKYLIIVLKRFTQQCRKRNDIIDIPLTFDGREYCVGPSKFKSKFKLISVGNHRGSTRGGHYYAYVRDIVSDNWFICNDCTVRPLNNINSISSPFAYCLIYEKINS